MCGYVGFTNHLGEQGSAVLQEMMQKIVHRGPDSDGIYTDDAICLGFRRLSIIDLSTGDQPIFNEDASKVLLFNGEIYNFKELREALLAAGHTFQTASDSEVILHGYEEYGTQVVERLRGMFSFVIWDKAEQTLFGARDPFGIKPLYYAFAGQSVLFGSEIKSFFPHPGFTPRLNERALARYLSFQYSPLEETFYQDVFKLPGGHCFTLKDGKMQTRRYWKPEFSGSGSGDVEAYADQIEQAIAESVEAHKISDVEVGSFLSSGVDSSYIAAAARVDKTFTVGFAGDKHYNEIGYAKEFAEAVGLNNTSYIISDDEYWQEFPNIQYHMDEPLADPAAAALYFVSRLAAEQVKVVLSGEGADELFGGYKIYQEPITLGAYGAVPFCIRRLIGKLAALLPPMRGRNYLVRRGKRTEEWFIGNANIFSAKEVKQLLKTVPGDYQAPQAICRRFYDEVRDKDVTTRMQYLDIHMWLMGDILLKADKMSMAHSLELRVPFLDKKVMALAETLPQNCRVNKETTKVALRKAAARSLPQKTAAMPKLGFPVPVRVWLREEKYYGIVKAAFQSDTAKRYFNTDFLLALLDAHKNGKCDNSRKIWTVYTFLVWFEAMGIQG